MNRRDLAAIVEQQKQQISKYESKLRDLVRAYKALQKERDALQTGLSALSSTAQAHPEPPDSDRPTSSDIGEKSKSNSEFSEKKSLEEENVDSDKQSGCREDQKSKEHEGSTQPVSQAVPNKKLDEHDSEVQKKIQSLSVALSEMTAEKERLHKNFMMERKKMNEEKEKVLADLKRSLDAETSSQSTIKELKQRISTLHSERDAEADNAVLRLRECQKVLSEQREAREKAELALQQAQHKLLQRPLQQSSAGKQDSQQQQQHLKQIAQHKNVVCQLESRVGSLEKDLKERETQLRQMEQLHAACATQLHQESVRAQEAEGELARVLVASRDREALLEARLADAANCVAATADNMASTATLHHLKTRVRELTELNQELNFKLSSVSKVAEEEEESADATQLLQRLKKIWLQLHLQALTPALRGQIEAVVGGSEVLHEACKQKQNSLLQQLVQLQQMSANTYPDGSSGDKESCESDDLKSVRTELRSVTAAAQVTETAHTAQIAQLKQECRSIRAEYEERLLSAQQSHRAVVCSLEQQLTSQRLHSIATLQERDVELHRLQQQLHSMSMENSQAKAPAALVCSTTAAARSGPLLHHIEELQRREQEVASLQQEKRQLQSAVREVQQAALEKRMQHEDRMTHLEMQLERFERNQSREGQSLEYLKNVLLHFLTSDGGGGVTRQALVKAVAAVLKLSPQEEEKLRKHKHGSDSWWWWGGGAKHTKK